MANSLTASSPTLWAKVSAYKLYKSAVFKSLASFDRKEALSYGQTIDRPYRADLVAEDYTKGGMSSTDIQDLTTTSNQISIDQIDTIWFKVDDVKNIISSFFRKFVCVFVQ